MGGDINRIRLAVYPRLKKLTKSFESWGEEVFLYPQSELVGVMLERDRVEKNASKKNERSDVELN
jgi:hypothetical protein